MSFVLHVEIVLFSSLERSLFTFEVVVIFSRHSEDSQVVEQSDQPVRSLPILTTVVQKLCGFVPVCFVHEKKMFFFPSDGCLTQILESQTSL